MKKWICKKCGYTHYGDVAPERCPQCGEPKSQFRADGCKKGWLLGVGCWMMVAMTAGIAFLSCRSSVTVNNSTVEKLDLKRYLGKWYEIARFDHRFERDMTHCTATYTLHEDGKLTVTNKGMKNGKWKTSEGKVKIGDQPGLLRVSFFGPFYSDYRIMMLDDDYTYALIGGNDDDYLWILSRTPEMDLDTRNIVIHEAKKRGYKTNNLIWVEQ